MTSREAMLFMKYEHYGKCKDSFKDTQRKCKYNLMSKYVTFADRSNSKRSSGAKKRVFFFFLLEAAFQQKG